MSRANAVSRSLIPPQDSAASKLVNERNPKGKITGPDITAKMDQLNKNFNLWVDAMQGVPGWTRTSVDVQLFAIALGPGIEADFTGTKWLKYTVLENQSWGGYAIAGTEECSWAKQGKKKDTDYSACPYRSPKKGTLDHYHFIYAIAKINACGHGQPHYNRIHPNCQTDAIIAHEMGHSLGLDDLYSTSKYANPTCNGKFSIPRSSSIMHSAGSIQRLDK